METAKRQQFSNAIRNPKQNKHKGKDSESFNNNQVVQTKHAKTADAHQLAGMVVSATKDADARKKMLD